MNGPESSQNGSFFFNNAYKTNAILRKTVQNNNCLKASEEEQLRITYDKKETTNKVSKEG